MEVVKYIVLSAMLLTYGLADAQLAVTQTVTDQDPAVPYSGSVSLDIRSGTPPYTFHGFGDTIVFPGDTITGFDSLAAGLYPIAVTDSTGDTVVLDLEVLYGVAWRNEVNVTATAHTIKRPDYGDYNAGASSYNRIPGSSDGYLEFTVANTTSNSDYVVGLAYGDYNTHHYSFAYAIGQVGTNVYLMSKGAAIAGVTQTATVGDRFRLEREGDNMKYYKNGTLVHTLPDVADYDRDLYLDVSIKRSISAVSGIRLSFGVAFDAYANVGHLAVEGHSSGSIDLNVRGGEAPYTYSWSDGPATATRSGLSKGTYGVTITDNASNTVTRSYTLGYQLGWTNATANVTTSPYSIYRNGPFTSPGGWPYTYSEGASSTNVIPPGGDGYLEFTVPFIAPASQVIGLTVNDLNTDLGSSRYTYFFASTGYAINENGVNVASGIWELGDVFRIERAGAYVRYYKNGVQLREIACDNGVRLIADVGIRAPALAFDNITASFGLDYGVYPVITHCTPDIGNDGMVDLNIKGGVPPYTVVWADATVGASRTGLAAGIYTVTVTDANSNTVTGSLEVGYKFKWQNTINTTGYDHSLEKTSGNTYNYTPDAGASSQNVLMPYTDGYVSFVIAHVYTNTGFVGNIGFSKEDYGTAANTIKYAFYVSNTGGRIDVNGTAVYNGFSFMFGDKLTIRRNGSTMYFDINGSTVYSTAVDPSEKLVLDNSLRMNPSRFWELHTNIGIPYGAYPIIGHLEYNNHTSGSIDLNVKGGRAPYSYNWSDGNTSASRSGLASGTYTVTITDALSATVTKSIELGYKIEWTDLTYVSATENSITKTSGLTAGGFSRNVLPANTDGYVEFHLPSSNVGEYIGLSRKNYGVGGNAQRYCFKIYAVYAAMVNYVAQGATGTSEIGDIFRISREGSTMKYFVNGSMIHSHVVDPNEELYLDVALSNNAYAEKIVASFGVPLGGYPTIVNDDHTNAGSASITMNTNGGTAPYTYQWADGSTSATRTGIGSGNYTVTITDANSNTVVNSYDVTYQIDWQNVTANTSVTSGTILKASGYNFWNGGGSSVQKLGANQNGYIEYEYDDINNVNAFGMSETDPDQVYNTIKYGLHIVSNNELRVYESGVKVASYTGPVYVGDILRVARVGNEIRYYLNNNVIHTTITDPTLELLLDASLNHANIIETPVRVSFGAPFSVSGTVTDITGGDPNSGAVSLAVTGGYGPYSYAWSNAATTKDLTGLSVGAYTVTVTDYLGSQKVGDFTVIDGTSLYWTGADDNDWDNASNWSWIPCGPSADTIPDSTMSVVFIPCDSISVQANLGSNTTIQTITYADGYSYLVDENSYTLTILNRVVFDGVDLTISTGTANLGNNVVFAGGNVTVSGGATLEVGNEMTVAGSVMEVDGTISAEAVTVASGAIISAGSLSINAALTIAGGTLDTDGNDISIVGAVNLSLGTVYNRTGSIAISGNTEQSGGTWDAGSGVLDLDADFLISAGNFYGNTSSIDINDAFNATGGSFASTSGILAVHGDFISTPYSFLHNGGTVKLLGADTDVDFNGDTILVDTTALGMAIQGGFHNLEFGTLSGSKTLYGDILVSGVLDINSDVLKLNEKTLTINNPSASALVAGTGIILVSGSYTKGYVKWQVNNGTGEFVIPYSDGSHNLAVTVDITTGGMSEIAGQPAYLIVGTYPASGSMEPMARDIDHFITTADDVDLDRVMKKYWYVDFQNLSVLPVGSMEIKYTDADVASQNGDEDDLQVQFWDGIGWADPTGTVFPSTNRIGIVQIYRGPFIAISGLPVLGRPVKKVYGQLADKLSSSYYHTIGGKVFFEYHNPYSIENLKVQVYDWQRNEMFSIPASVQALPGNNWLELSLSSASLEYDKYYILEVTNGKGVVKKMRIKYTSNSESCATCGGGEGG